MADKRRYSIDTPDQQRLKVARLEIEAVLKKHDLAGAVVLHTPGMAEWFYDIQPSYSCAWIDEKKSAMRLKSKLADYGGDAELQRHDQAATANMLSAMASELTNATCMFASLSMVADRALQAEHAPGGHVPDPMEGKRQ